jgi:hypothetical protein
MRDKLSMVLSAIYKADRRGIKAIPVDTILHNAKKHKITIEDVYEVAYEDWITEATYSDPITGMSPKAYKIMPKGIQYLANVRQDRFLTVIALVGLAFSAIAAVTGILQMIN